VVAPGLPRRIAFLGFGLIGGSIAKALRRGDRSIELTAWTPNGEGPAAGVRLGVLDRAAPTATAAIEGAELIVLAGPPLAVLQNLADLAGPWHSHLAADATITDVASTKGAIVEAANALGLPFVGGHPMAGREASGVGASTPDLFLERPWVVVAATGAGDRDVARVEAIAAAVGARVVHLAADAHDRAVAAISHLPLVVAAALVEAVTGGPDWEADRGLAATGWADMTRLAKGDPEMGAGILATNAAAVSDRLRDLRRALDGWIEALDAGAHAPDAPALRDRLAAARAALDPEASR
jgi:prephenate dehydrogenase